MSTLIWAVVLALTAIALLGVWGLAITALRRWPALGLYGVGAFILIAWEIPAPPTLVSAFGLQVKPEDVLFAVLAGSAALQPQRLLSNTRNHRVLTFWVVASFVVTLAVSVVVLGSAAINEARTMLWTVGMVAWFLNHDWADDKLRGQFQKWVILTGWGLTAVFVYHFAIYGLGSADSFVAVDPAGEVQQTGRPLVAGQAFALAAFGLFMFTRTSSRKGWQVLSGLVFLVLAILCQHRSVWAAVAVAAIYGLSRLRGPARANTIFWGIYAIMGLSIPLLLGAFDSLIEDISYALSSTGTYSERAESWRILVAEAIKNGSWSVTFGTPFGTGYDRVVNGAFVTYSPHNWYVIIFLRLGLVGLIAYLLVLLSIIRGLAKRKEWVALSVFVGLSVYCWAYALPWYLGVVFAWCAFQGWRAMPEKAAPPSKRRCPSLAHARSESKLSASS